MPSRDENDGAAREYSRELPLGSRADNLDGPGGRLEGMHIHVHLGEKASHFRARSFLVMGCGVVVALLGFLAGTISADSAGSRRAEADFGVARGPAPPRPVAGPYQPPRIDFVQPAPVVLEPSLQSQLAQRPRIVPPPAPTAIPVPMVPPAAGQPSGPPRNAFGLER